jgi:hypothetical protein
MRRREKKRGGEGEKRKNPKKLNGKKGKVEWDFMARFHPQTI